MKDLIIVGHPVGAWVLTDSPEHLSWKTTTCVGAIRMSADGRFIISRLPASEPIFYAETFEEARQRIMTMAVVEYMDQTGGLMKDVEKITHETLASRDI